MSVMLNRARIARYSCFLSNYISGCNGFLSFSTFVCTAIQRQDSGRICKVGPLYACLDSHDCSKENLWLMIVHDNFV